MTVRFPMRRMSCNDARRELEWFALDEVSGRIRRALRRHLEGCGECRQALTQRRELLSLVPLALDPVEPPPEVFSTLLGRVGGRRPARRRFGPMLAAAAVSILVLVWFVIPPIRAALLGRALESPNVAVINLFPSIDSPLSARYEYRTESAISFERSVGRILLDLESRDWQLVVHGLPRPPRGARYMLTALIGDREQELGELERWEWGVATLRGRSAEDLLASDRIALTLVGPQSRLRLLEASDGAW